MHAIPRRRALRAVLAAALLASGLGAGSARADHTGTDNGTVGARAGFAAGWQLVWLDDATMNAELDGMARSGAKWLRFDFDWPSIQPTPESWNWGPTDRLVRAATARGLQILATPTYTPPWARPEGSDDKHAPSDHWAYARFAGAAAERYKGLGVRHWEIWNEPNQWHWWKPMPDPWAYTSLLQHAHGAIKAADPGATVIAGGLAPAPDAPDGSEINGETFVRRMYEAGARGSFDALAMHPYNYPVEPMYPHVMNAFSSTTPAIRQVMVDHGDEEKKLWLTEYGAPTSGDRAVSEQEQADFLVQAYDQVARWPWTGPLLYYMQRDQGWDLADRYDNFGLLRRDWSWKPGMSAFVAQMGKAAP